VARDGAGGRCDVRSALTQPELRSLSVLGRAFAGTVRRHASRQGGARAGVAPAEMRVQAAGMPVSCTNAK
jgi:hypothetical protein